MTLDRRIEELVAVGASVTANCGPCLRAHTREAQESGASSEEIAAAIAVGQKVRKGAASKMDEAVAALGAPASATAKTPSCCAGAT
jgi:AhpD family alkylhydroperoxidase